MRRAVAGKDIVKILQTVNLAPSAGNLQAYKVYVVKNKNIIAKICATSGGIVRNFENKPPIMLIFCADKEMSAERYKRRGEELYSIQDATIAPVPMPSWRRFPWVFQVAG